jgi:hypothetical protein
VAHARLGRGGRREDAEEEQKREQWEGASHGSELTGARTPVEAHPILDIRRTLGVGLVAKPLDTQPEQVDYIACDLPDDMTLAQFRRARCQEQRRVARLRELGTRWLRRTPRD